ncbi:uncharacterized protein [Montipora foliosa]|uniref:uncharacterized protein n=1 Tax=Montipora foliosa TaxID=591990 RepID=UPI0035F1B9BF
MANVRDQYWIPRLRRLTKRVVKACSHCRRFGAVACAAPPVAPLPEDRTEGTTPFQVIGVDYAGLLIRKVSKKKQWKAYFLLYSCSLTRAIHLELIPTLDTLDFIWSFKRFIARRGRPRKVYSDNGRTFIGAAKWLQKVMKDECFHDFLARNVEVALNGRPLSYVEDDHQLPVLTPNSLLYPQSNVIPDLDAHHIDEHDLRKRAKHLRPCRQNIWKQWSAEYVRGLRERHNLKHQSKTLTLKPGDVVIIRGDDSDRNKWKLGVVKELIEGRDGLVRAAKLRAGLGEVTDLEHEITIDPEVKPVSQHSKRIPVSKIEAVNNELDRMLEQDIIEEVTEATIVDRIKWNRNAPFPPNQG